LYPAPLPSGMFHELADDPGERTPEGLLALYADALSGAVEATGVAAIAAETGLAEPTVEAVAAAEGDASAVADLALEDAAAVLAVAEDAPDPDDIVALSLDALLMGMTNAVLDVEAVEAGIDGRMEPRTIQQKVEGRHPITLEEYALLHSFIAGRAYS